MPPNIPLAGTCTRSHTHTHTVELSADKSETALASGSGHAEHYLVEDSGTLLPQHRRLSDSAASAAGRVAIADAAATLSLEPAYVITADITIAVATFAPVPTPASTVEPGKRESLKSAAHDGREAGKTKEGC